ncbi:MAG TPA: anhydro-N-acetylmuramic acid kinase [Terriglobales bacterium]|jgi:anhydro-N-acetylmuramic acid kinase|nr:anhydro-N-acetylmuramic acid kinase [Terriglobales bacterium]
MIVAGVMSGTSADGIDVAVVRALGSGWSTRFGLLTHHHFPYPAAVRRAVLSAMNATHARVADLARLNFLLGELYAAAVLATQKRAGIRRLDLVGCHGQTLYHQGRPAPFLGHDLAVTWQTGEGAILAARTQTPVVSDFRPADMAAGGQGAPLVPFLDYLLYRHRSIGRVVQNLGGIANLTAIPGGAEAERVVAFDTGPGNMVMDGAMERLFGRPCDRDGRIAARGSVLEPVVTEVLRLPFFQQPPPRSAGREQFGREFVARFLRRCGRARKEDVVATATALTARSIGAALQRFVLKENGYREFVVSGGGAANPTLLNMIQAEIVNLGLVMRRSEDFGLPREAKEAVAFALLAYQTWQRRPGNLPSATGAERPAVLGKISYP